MMPLASKIRQDTIIRKPTRAGAQRVQDIAMRDAHISTYSNGIHLTVRKTLKTRVMQATERQE